MEEDNWPQPGEVFSVAENVIWPSKLRQLRGFLIKLAAGDGKSWGFSHHPNGV